MDLKHRVVTQKEKKPSKLLMLSALVFAFSLPYILVKTFGDKPRTPNEQTIKLPNPIDKGEKTEIQPTTAIQNGESTFGDKTQPEPIPNARQVKPEPQWDIIITKPGDSLASIFKRLELSPKTLQLILKNHSYAKALNAIKPNQKLQFLIQDHQLETFIFPLSATKNLNIQRKDNHYQYCVDSRQITTHNHFITAHVEHSLYHTAKRYNVPYKLLQQMATIFNWEIDFSRDVRPGDQFTIVYQAYFVENKKVGVGDIIAVRYKNKRKTFEAVRHEDKKGHVGYYTPEGRSLKKAFTRYPVKFSHISSPFSLSRKHPVLKRTRPHKGVDLAATIGTPIRAVGDGRIELIGPNNGYGNMVKINHNKTYTTIYAHMLRFQKGLSRGDYVKRGEVIGYVGQSGLATGPHCHFEFHINHTPKNPTTVSLPLASPIPKSEMASFQSSTGTLLAQMEIYEQAQFAANTTKANTRQATA